MEATSEGRGLTKDNLADHSKLYPEYPVLLRDELLDARRIASLGAQASAGIANDLGGGTVIRGAK